MNQARRLQELLTLPRKKDWEDHCAVSSRNQITFLRVSRVSVAISSFRKIVVRTLLQTHLSIGTPFFFVGFASRTASPNLPPLECICSQFHHYWLPGWFLSLAFLVIDTIIHFPQQWPFNSSAQYNIIIYDYSARHF